MGSYFTMGRSDATRSAELKQASRRSGVLFTPVYDEECSDCYEVFVPHTPGTTRCRRCRRNRT